MGLRDARERRGWTQHELARRAGLAQSTIAMLETRPKADPPWSTVRKLSIALRVNPESLFGSFPQSSKRGRKEADL